MNALVPRESRYVCTARQHSCAYLSPTGARCHAPFCPAELRRAAHERLAEGDTGAYLWGTGWNELWQSARSLVGSHETCP